MVDNGWDWSEIHVYTGEWWLLLIAILAGLLGLALGYVLGQRRERRRLGVREEGGFFDDRDPGPGA